MSAVGVLEVLDASGHLSLTWNPENPDEVERAREEFSRLKKAGYSFFTEGDKEVRRLPAGGSVDVRLVRVEEFKPRAPRTVAVRPMRGG